MPDQPDRSPARPEATNATAAHTPRCGTTTAGSTPAPGGSDADANPRSSPRRARTPGTTTAAAPRPDRPRPATPRPRPRARIRSARLLVQPTTPGRSLRRGGQPVHGRDSLAGPSPRSQLCVVTATVAAAGLCRVTDRGALQRDARMPAQKHDPHTVVHRQRHSDRIPCRS